MRIMHRSCGENSIGALCGATLEIARAGLTERLGTPAMRRVTSKKMVPEYNDERFYVEELAVTDRRIIMPVD